MRSELSIDIKIARRLCAVAGIDLGHLICGYKRKTGKKCWTLNEKEEIRIMFDAISLMFEKQEPEKMIVETQIDVANMSERQKRRILSLDAAKATHISGHEIFSTEIDEGYSDMLRIFIKTDEKANNFIGPAFVADEVVESILEYASK